MILLKLFEILEEWIIKVSEWLLTYNTFGLSFKCASLTFPNAPWPIVFKNTY